jgi:signal transduction histidine kinase
MRTVEAPLALCSSSGSLQVVTPHARALLCRLSLEHETPAALPADLWNLLEHTPTGEAVEWRPPGARGDVLGCTRYDAAHGSYLILMREVSGKHIALSERLQRQRMESTERLVTSVAHDIRGSVASIVYSTDFLEIGGSSVTHELLRETLRDICAASRRLELTVSGLLDYARLGPSVSVPVLLADVVNRAQGLLRDHYRRGAHRLRVNVAPHAQWVRGNPITIEQIFVNLLLNSAEASATPRYVVVSAVPSSVSRPSRDKSLSYTRVQVWDDGPGIPQNFRQFVFDPFFTTKQQRPGLGLTIARQAAESLDGELVLGEAEQGTCFALYLPRCEAPE